MKGVYQRGQIYYIDYYVGGRRVREAVGENKKLAEVVLKKRKVEIAEGKFLDIKKEEKVKFEDFADTFINLHSKPNKRSWESDLWNLKPLMLLFRGKCLYEITAQDVEQYKAGRSKSVSP